MVRSLRRSGDRLRRGGPAAPRAGARLGALLCAACAVAAPAPPAAAQTPVSIELVFAVDTSESVDGFEYRLMMIGIAEAFRTPEIVDLIGQQDGVAVALFQWSSEIDDGYVIPWHLLRDPASVRAFAARVETAGRDPNRGFTGIGEAIDFGVRLIASNGFAGSQLKIDISGDGRNNFGRVPALARRGAEAAGIVINGLPILTHSNVDSHDLDTYYREEVIHGPGAFIEIAKDYDDFARAFLRKLRREISPVVSERAPRPFLQAARAR